MNKNISSQLPLISLICGIVSVVVAVCSCGIGGLLGIIPLTIGLVHAYNCYKNSIYNGFGFSIIGIICGAATLCLFMVIILGIMVPDSLTKYNKLVTASPTATSKESNASSENVEKPLSIDSPDTSIVAKPSKTKAKPEPKTYKFSDGNYVSGSDFKPGTYDVKAISGNGNIHSNNMFDGGLNVIMGVANDNFYSAEFKNAELPDGTKLTITGGLTVQLTMK